jgi:hypothetical protein
MLWPMLLSDAEAPKGLAATVVVSGKDGSVTIVWRASASADRV